MGRNPTPFDQGPFSMHVHKGKEYFDQNHLQQARIELESAYHLRPQDEKVLNLLGMTYFKLGLLPQAEEMYVQLAGNNPDIYTLQSNLGLIRLKLDKMIEAEDSLIRALELQPGNQKAHFYLGLLYEKMARWEMALSHFELAGADKMVQKMKDKIQEEQTRIDQSIAVSQTESSVSPPIDETPKLLSFEVLEVLSVNSQELAESIEQETTAVTEEEQAVEEKPPVEERLESASVVPLETSESIAVETGGVVFEAESEAVVDENLKIPEEETAAAPAQKLSDTFKFKQEELLKTILQGQNPFEEEEDEDLVEDQLSAENEVFASEETEMHIEEADPVWEKTDPRMLLNDHSVDSQLFQTSETSGPPLLGSSFFLPEETAADISLFLAQTREQDDEEEIDTGFIEEPPGNFAVVRQEVEQEQFSENATDVSFDNTIPAPEEIEKSAISGSFSVPEKAEFIEQLAEEPAVIEEEEVEEILEEEENDEADDPFASATVEFPAAEHVVQSVVADLQQEPVVEQIEQPANLDQFSRDRFYIQPLIGADRFLLIDPHLLEIIVSERMICRKGTVSGFTGNLQFQPLELGEHLLTSLIHVEGGGIVFLADKRREIFLLSLNDESIFVEMNHLLVAQSALKIEPHFLGDEQGQVSVLKIFGRGTLALTCQTKALTLNVHETMPVNIPADSLIAWSGPLHPEVTKDREMQSIMTQFGEENLLLRFAGKGDVVIEQGSLWGDRRGRR